MGILDTLSKFAANTPAGMITSALGQVLDRVLPEDAATREAAALEVMKMQAAGTFEQKADLQVALAQAGTNTAEAAGGGFKAGWRPLIGYIGGTALGLQWIVAPYLPWLVTVIGGHQVPALPALDIQQILGLVGAMLGLGTLRTAEKIKGAA